MAQVTISEASATLLRELWDGMRREHGDVRTEAELVDDAVARVHRGFFGLPPGTCGPEQPTGPFRKWASDRRAEVLLRQVDATRFRLSQPFRYIDRQVRFEVPEGNVTDLASVPGFLTWLVPRYGRHTLAALLHDHLQKVTEVSPERADVIFRDAMGQTGVPLARRWLMWSAVALRTEWEGGGLLRRARAGAWCAVFVAVGLFLWPTAAIVASRASGWARVGRPALVLAVALALPIALSWVWGPLWVLGAVGGVALELLTLPVVLVLLALGGYLGLEWLGERLLVPAGDRNPVLTRTLLRRRGTAPVAQWAT